MNAKHRTAAPSPPHTAKRLAFLAGALALAVTTAAPFAWAAAAKGPKADGNYTSPVVDINVNLSASSVRVSSTCNSSGASPIDYQWQSPTLALHGDAFSFRARQTIYKMSVQTGKSVGRYKAKVLVDGRFTDGRFVGVFDLGGSPCAKSSYVAKLVTSSGSGA